MKKLFNIKIIFISILVIFFLVNLAFAYTSVYQANTSSISSSSSMPESLQSLANILNLLWLPFSIIAWKLMTNDLLYWQAFGIDLMLEQIWNFSRELANYILWFVFIVAIFWIFIWKTKNIWVTLGKVVLASILVNASWFIFAVIIDISSIMIIAAWSLPWWMSMDKMKDLKYCKEQVISITQDSSWFPKPLFQCEDGKEGKIWFENLYNKLNSMSWPLIYMGSSILNIDKNWWVLKTKISSSDNPDKIFDFSEMIHALIIICFVVPIIILMVISLVRLFWIWIYIGFSPLLILDYVFGSKYISAKNKNLKLSNVLWLIFQPVLVVMALSISLIFLLTLQSALSGDDSKEDVKKAIWICNDDKSLCVNEKPLITIEWYLKNNFIEEVWWIFWYLIITLLTLFMVWSLIKMSFKATEVTSWIADRAFKFVDSAFMAVPIIPTPKWLVWLWAAWMWLKTSMSKNIFWMQAAERANKLTEKINNFFWVWEFDLSQVEKREWQNKFLVASSKNTTREKIEVLENFLKYVVENKPNLIPDASPIFKELITEHMVKILGEGKIKDIFWISLWKKEHITADKLFSSPNFKKALSNIINWNVMTTKQNLDTYFKSAVSRAWDSNISRAIKDIKTK